MVELDAAVQELLQLIGSNTVPLDNSGVTTVVAPARNGKIATRQLEAVSF